MTNCSTVRYFGGAFFMDSQAGGDAAPTIVNPTVARTRECLTGSEVEALMAAARKSSRYGHRDATMILIAYRHGLRASEVRGTIPGRCKPGSGTATFSIRCAIRSWLPIGSGISGEDERFRLEGNVVHAVVGRTQEYVSGGCRLLRGDSIGSRGRRGSIFVFISTGKVFLSLLAGMSAVGRKTTDSASTAVYTALAPNRFRDFWRG
jgi:hypothetical protein